MKILELIKILNSLPNNAEVYHCDNEYGISNPSVDFIKDYNEYWISEGEHHVEH